MPKRIPGPIERYEFTEEEAYSHCIFSAEQLMYLQSEMGAYMQLKINISGEDYLQPEVFIRSQEAHRGAIDALHRIIVESERLQMLQEETIKLRAEMESYNNRA